MLFSNTEVMITSSTVLWHQKESTLKVQIFCSDGIKMSNQGMGEVDLDDQNKSVHNLEQT